METRLVNGLRRNQAQPAQQFDAGRHADKQPLATQALAFADGQNGRHDDGTGVHRSAFERVVVVLAVGRGAVDQRGAERIESLRVAYGGGRSRLAGAEGSRNIEFRACRHREAGHIDD